MRKKLLLSFCSALCILTVAGCSVNVNVPNKSSNGTEAKDTVVTNEGTSEVFSSVKEDTEKIVPEVKTEVPERFKDDEGSKETGTEITQDEEISEETNDSTVEMNELTSSSWKDLKFTLEGVEYSIFDNLSVLDFEAAGWHIDGNDVDTIEAGTYAILNYENDDFEDASLTLCVGNKSDSDISLSEGLVFSVDYCANYGWRLVDNYPDINVHGIGVGASIDNVKAVFGEPYDVYNGEKSTIYTYNDSDGCSFKVTFIEGIGASEFDFTWSSWSFN